MKAKRTKWKNSHDSYSWYIPILQVLYRSWEVVRCESETKNRICRTQLRRFAFRGAGEPRPAAFRRAWRSTSALLPTGQWQSPFDVRETDGNSTGELNRGTRQGNSNLRGQFLSTEMWNHNISKCVFENTSLSTCNIALQPEISSASSKL